MGVPLLPGSTSQLLALFYIAIKAGEWSLGTRLMRGATVHGHNIQHRTKEHHGCFLLALSFAHAQITSSRTYLATWPGKKASVAKDSLGLSQSSKNIFKGYK